MNELYFDNLDSRAAYIVGIAAANTCIDMDGKCITILHKDKDILLDIVTGMGIVNPLRCIVGAGPAYTITLNCSSIVGKLLALGLDHSGKVNVPRGLFRDFLRGYIEGRAEVYIHEGTKDTLDIVMEDTYDRLNWIQGKVHTIIGLPKRKVMSKIPGRIKKMMYTGKPAVLLLTWLYQNVESGAPHSKLIKEPYDKYLSIYPDRGTYLYNTPCPGSKKILLGDDIVQG
jgi:hypothetical protein